jgi:hypothetical protein
MIDARWPEPWLYHLEADIIASRSLEEAIAVWKGYELELKELETQGARDPQIGKLTTKHGCGFIVWPA